MRKDTDRREVYKMRKLTIEQRVIDLELTVLALVRQLAKSGSEIRCAASVVEAILKEREGEALERCK